MNILLTITQRKISLFLLLFVAVFIAFAYGQHGKFTNDILGGLYDIQQLGIKSIYSSTIGNCYFYQVPLILLYSTNKVFGTNWLGWHLVWSLLHAANAFVFYLLLKRLMGNAFRPIATLFPVFFFLLSPFQTENVIWGATIHYLIMQLIFLLCLNCILSYYKQRERKFLVYFILLYTASLFCYEQAFVLPVLFGVFYFLFVFDRNNQPLKEFITKFLGANLLLLTLYFVLNRILYGSFITHYGADVHFKFDVLQIITTFKNYFLKFFFFHRYDPWSIKQLFVTLDARYITHVFSLIVFVGGSIFCWMKRADIIWRIVLFCLIAYCVMLAPVLNLDNSFTFEIQSDRYGYLPSLFFYFGWGLLLMKIMDGQFYIASSLYLTLCIFLLIPTVNKWHEAGILTRELINNYPCSPEEEVYILNLPDNHRGAYVFRNCFAEGLSLFKNQHYDRKKIHFIAMVNTTSLKDETEVWRLKDVPSRAYHVGNRFGNKWFYVSGAGAQDYENEHYTFDVDQWNTAYEVNFKNISDTTKVLKVKGTEWVEIW
ncbi:MAG: hypothetical protein K1X55_02465 [Chitinophagales bacterium]|nr:hypothetical protein [Chitinophagales bacterium]